jgi:hypothetical protein
MRTADRTPMLTLVQLRRLTAATLVCASVVLGLSFLIATPRAAPAGGVSATHTCSAADKQFLATVSSNMEQLQYWSDSLQSGDATPAVVIKQAHAESEQVAVTAPTDPSLQTARSLLRKMFLEYGAAVRARALGSPPGIHVRNAYTLANGVHELLFQAQPGMTAKGCDLTPLLRS